MLLLMIRFRFSGKFLQKKDGIISDFILTEYKKANGQAKKDGKNFHTLLQQANIPLNGNIQKIGMNQMEAIAAG